jgi:hypothetical protein
MSRRLSILATVLLSGLTAAQAHSGHHHDTGLPDFAAHIFLGLQILAALLVPAAAIAFFLRSARSKKNPPNQEK